MALPETFRRIRLGRGISQSKAAHAAGVSTTQYQNYEYGKSEPTASVLFALADFYDVTLDYLVGFSPFPDYSSSEDLTPFPYLCERMKLLRDAKKMDVFDIAELLDISPRSYAGYEAGEVLPRLRTICAIADYFDVSIDYLIGRSDTPNSHEL